MFIPPFRPGLGRGLFRACFFASVLFASLPSFADPRLAGHWEGEVALPGAKLGFDVDLKAGGDKLAGDISIPAQQLHDYALSDLKFDGGTVRFVIGGIPGEPTFEGKLSEDGSKIAGTLSQGAGSFPFEMVNTAHAAADTQSSLADFDAALEKAVADWNVPGMGVAVVARGEVVYARGFGFRDVEGQKPMTADSLFAIGSTTKAMTATLLGMLVDEGKLQWDEPLVRYLPEFRLADAAITARVTPRDLLTHRTGLPRHDMVWYNNQTATREEIIARMAHLELTADLRETWQYNNLAFLTAGYLGGKLAGTTWEEAMRTRLLAPLGMERTVFSVKDMERDGDHALPYDRKDGKLVRIPYRNIDLAGPAGSVDSSVNEMARWLLFNLKGGKVGDRQLIQATTLGEIQAPQMVLPPAGPEAQIAQRAYGMGWGVSVYRGHRMVEHGGGIDGFTTSVSFFPDDGIGIVAFTNRGSALPNLAAREIADQLLGLDKVEWMAEALARVQAGEAIGQEGEKKLAGMRAKDRKPSHPLAAYPGVYDHPGYGRLEVLAGKGDALAIRFNGIEVPLEHWHYDVWSGADNKGGDPAFEKAKFLFRTDFDGEITAVESPLEPTAKPIVFIKQADPRLTDPAYLERFRGTYRGDGGAVARVEVTGSKLTLKVDHQPLFTLVPEASGRFGIEGLQGYSLAFTEGAAGQMVKIVFYQPNGVFESTRVEETPQQP